MQTKRELLAGAAQIERPPPGEPAAQAGGAFGTSLAQRINGFGDHAVLTEAEFAAMSSKSVSQIQHERLRGAGCPHIQLSGRRIGYLYGDCKRFLEAQRTGGAKAVAAARLPREQAA